MKPRLKPILAALLASSVTTSFAAASVASAAVSPPASSVIVGSDLFISSDIRSTPDLAGNDVVIAQAGGPGKQIQIFSSGTASDLSGLPDIDALVSSAMSEAFAGAHVSHSTKNVKNAPYSAEIITEKVQKLQDGNEIVKRSTSLSYRDSAGRTRQETRDTKGELRSIQINDTVDGSRIVLTPSSKTATRISVDKDFMKRIEGIKERARNMVKDGKATVIERSNPGEEIIVHRAEGATADGRKELREEVKVNVVRASGSGNSVVYKFPGDGPSIGAALGDLTRLSPIGMSFQDGKWSSKATTTQLGTRDFDGVRADGKSTSYTIPAGEIGNRNAITVTNETWYSPDLQATVYSKHSDPRTGDTIYRMTNVKRTEQPATLFVVPDGYTVKETAGLSYNFRTEKK